MISFVMDWDVWVFLEVGLVWVFFVGFFELKAERTKVCQTASHRACVIQDGTDFIAFEDFWLRNAAGWIVLERAVPSSCVC